MYICINARLPYKFFFSAGAMQLMEIGDVHRKDIIDHPENYTLLTTLDEGLFHAAFSEILIHSNGTVVSFGGHHEVYTDFMDFFFFQTRGEGLKRRGKTSAKPLRPQFVKTASGRWWRSWIPGRSRACVRRSASHSLITAWLKIQCVHTLRCTWILHVKWAESIIYFTVYWSLRLTDHTFFFFNLKINRLTVTPTKWQVTLLPVMIQRRKWIRLKLQTKRECEVQRAKYLVLNAGWGFRCFCNRDFNMSWII